MIEKENACRMKKILIIAKFFFSKSKGFVKRKRKFVLYSSIFVLITSAISMRYSKLLWLIAFMFGGSLLCIVRTLTYKVGKIPFLMSDKTWDSLRLKYSEEEADEKYRELSLKVAAICYPISVISFIVWATIEIIFMILK